MDNLELLLLKANNNIHNQYIETIEEDIYGTGSLHLKNQLQVFTVNRHHFGWCKNDFSS